MSELSDPREYHTKKLVVWFYLLLTIIAGFFTLFSILQDPTQSAKTIIFSLSAPRLILFIWVLAITLIAFLILIKYTYDKNWTHNFLGKLTTQLANPRLFGTILGISFICIIWGSNIIIQIPEIIEPVALAYYLRLQPVISWLLFLAGQTILGIYILRYGLYLHTLKAWGRRIYLYLLILGLMLILTIWITGTRYGLVPIDVGIGWHSLGTPILLSQLLVAWAITTGLLMLWMRLRLDQNPNQKKRIFTIDLIISLALWITAFSSWMVQPLKANWFASEPRPPNFQFYPSSDASVYDITAINLSLGAGFKTRGSSFTLRPLYSTFLAGLHQIAGKGYEEIIWLQVAFLAFIPVFLFLLTKILHHRASGLLVALLFIFREMNAIKLGDSISDAHAKLLMPFLPTTLGIAIFLWLFTRWLKNPIGNVRLALGAGGVLGLFMLVRPEVGILLPFIAFAALIQLRKMVRVWIKGMIFISIGLVLALAPWIWRNYQLTGTIYIDSPHYRLDLLNKRYREEPIGFTLPNTVSITPEVVTAEPFEVPLLSTTQSPLEPISPDLSLETIEPSTELEGNGKPSVSPSPEVEIQIHPIENTIPHATEGFASEVLSFIKNHPGETISFITNHLMNSIIQSVLYFPTTYPITQSAVKFFAHKSPQIFWMDCCSLVDYERKLPFWPKWDGVLPRSSYIPLTITLILISIGIGVSWCKEKYIGLIPLLSAFSYYLINALVRNSGGRYIVPINWVGFFYFSVGLIHLSLLVLSFFQRNLFQVESTRFEQPFSENEKSHTRKWRYFSIAALIFFIATILPVLEVTIPQKYDQNSLELKYDAVFSDTHYLSSTELTYLNTFLRNNGQVIQGQALYPRFHKPYQMGSVWRIYYDRPYSHVDFYISSPGDTGVILPLADPPQNFPHGSEILVFGCSQEEDLQALLVIIFTADGNINDVLWRSPFPDNPTCPLLIPD